VTLTEPLIEAARGFWVLGWDEEVKGAGLCKGEARHGKAEDGDRGEMHYERVSITIEVRLEEMSVKKIH
jgi:hypothetical protein